MPSTPHDDRAPVSPTDLATSAGGTASPGSQLFAFAALALASALALPKLTRRLRWSSAVWRPMPLLSLLERPG
jgi:hypothetical protein